MNETSIVPTVASETSARAKRQSRNREHVLAGVFILPNVFFYTLFLIVPLVGTFVLSLTDWNGFNFSELEIKGFENYVHLSHDAEFWSALGHNLLFVIGNVILATALALFAAVLLEQRLPGSHLIRALFLIPTVLSYVVVGLVFKFAFSPSVGFVNPFLRSIGLDQYAGEWLGDADRALPLLIAIEIWRVFGLYMFLFIARLITIPEEIHEAASVDGCNWFQDLRHITLPLMRSTVVMVTMLAAINSLKLFALVKVMTNGGPGHASEVLSTYAYLQAFSSNKVGYGSAIQIVLLVITFAVAIVQSRLSSGEESYS